jgi:hypothetical protein
MENDELSLGTLNSLEFSGLESDADSTELSISVRLIATVYFELFYFVIVVVVVVNSL